MGRKVKVFMTEKIHHSFEIDLNDYDECVEDALERGDVSVLQDFCSIQTEDDGEFELDHFVEIE